MHTSEKKSVKIWAPKPCVSRGTARHELNTDGIADCYKRTGKDAEHFMFGYEGPCQ